MSGDNDQAGPAPARRPASVIVTQTASQWLVRRDRGLDAAEARALAAWLAADPRHGAELTRLEGTWRGLDQIGADAALAAEADAVVGRVRARRARRRVFTVGWLTAAAALVAVAVSVVGRREAAPVSAESPVEMSEKTTVLASTAHRVTLPDGSVAELNGESRIETDFTPTERRVRLVHGEAHFIVMKNRDRPFLVSVGPVTVRAVGTAFNVRLAAQAIEVLVTEGKVRLDGITATADSGRRDGAAAAPALTSGDRAVVDTARQGPPVVSVKALKPVEVEEALGWQSTRLVFNATPLDEVVAAFNRYNRRQLALGRPELRARTLTGAFRADNLDAFIRLLEASIEVRAEPRADGVIALFPTR